MQCKEQISLLFGYEKENCNIIAACTGGAAAQFLLC
jgi:hypothetical protein